MEQGTTPLQPSQRTFGFSHCITAQFVIPACVAGLTALAFACPASAADFSAQRGVRMVQERLAYRDLDLTTRQGAQVLVKRVEAAAQNLCAPAGPPLVLGPSVEERQCRQQATARAIAQVGSPLVSAEYAGRTGRSHRLEAVASRP
jgi:UrcA family protein